MISFPLVESKRQNRRTVFFNLAPVNQKLIYSLIYMIRNVNNVNNKNNSRNASTSQESNKLKKSNSATSKNPSNTPGIGYCGMTNSIKSRVETSNSNKKKNLLNTSNSNKSLKALRENANSKGSNVIVNTATYKKKQEKENKQIKEQKKGTIMVKSIKSKIVGTSISTTAKGDKQNIFKKKSETQCLTNTTMNAGNMYINTQSSLKTPRTPKDKIKSQSFMGLSLVGKRQSQRASISGNLSLDLFQLGRKLGKGRFGDVYMAREIRSGFALAIKVISKKQLKESQMEGQLIQQIKIQMYSNHPNILKMYGFFSDQNKIYLLLELATNGCLFKEIRQKAYFSQDLACYYFRQVASGIRYLHSNYVIHRDIKPQNILNCFNVLKICDFGWAIYSPIYQRQTFCGTLDYVPPQIVTGEFYDEKADVWCLGVLCYELCTGKAPFESKTDENQTYDKILKVQIQFPIYLSQKVVDFIGRILNRDPQKRINLEEIQTHQWMRAHQNQTGRMICKQIWDQWMKFSK